MLDRFRELDLQPPGKIEAMLGLHDVGDPTLAALAIYADDRFVAATDVLGVDRQVRNTPGLVVVRLVTSCRGLAIKQVEALFDRVLVAAGERGVHEVANVRVARMHRKTVAIFGDATQRIDIADVQLGVDTHCEQVHRQIDDVYVSGALAVAKQRSFHPIGASHHPELGGGDTAAAIVMRVQADLHAGPIADVASEPLDDIAVHVWRVALHRCRQVEHDRPFRRWLDDVHHGVTDVERELGLGEGEAFGRILVTNLAGTHGLFQLAGHTRRVDGYIDDARLIEIEDGLALQRIGGVVKMHDCFAATLQAFIGAFQQFFTTLHQDLDGDVVGNEVLLDQFANEVEVGLACRRKADLDLFETHLHEGVEHAPFAL